MLGFGAAGLLSQRNEIGAAGGDARILAFICEITEMPPKLCVNFVEMYGYYGHFAVGVDFAGGSRFRLPPKPRRGFAA
jgi:hypothetical protein